MQDLSKLPSDRYSIRVKAVTREAQLLFKDRDGYNDVIATERFITEEFEKCIEELIRRAHAHSVQRDAFCDTIQSRGWESFVTIEL